MPNHCTNNLSVSGPSKDVALWVDAHCEKDANGEHVGFSFNGSVPEPEQLKGIYTGACTIDGEPHRIWRQVDGEAVAIPEAEQEQWKRDYKSTNLYDWHCANWGTKWNAYDVSVEAVGDGFADIRYTTAWGPPDEWLHKMAEKYPTLEFYNGYMIEGEEPCIHIPATA